MDDGSTDGSDSICEELTLRDNMCVVIHKKNQGKWAARNAGKKSANGKFHTMVVEDNEEMVERN